MRYSLAELMLELLDAESIDAGEPEIDGLSDEE